MVHSIRRLNALTCACILSVACASGRGDSEYTETGTGSESTTTTTTTTTDMTMVTSMTSSKTTTTTGTESGSDTRGTEPTTTGDPICGDGNVDDGEQCDDTNDVDDDGCTSCMLDCGNNTVQGDEECDDGNTVDGDNCTNACEHARCGDGIINEEEGDKKEECDEGPLNGEENVDGASCRFGCILNRCGDGDQGPDEECDDSNTEDADGCSSACTLERTVFITKKLYTGNLGGLQGANTLCQAAADDAQLGGTYKAWLSDSDTGPADNFGADATADEDADTTRNYRLTNSTLIATSWSDLTDGELLNPIIIDEDKKPVDPTPVWSNTTAEGTPLGMINCTSWTSEQGGMMLGATGRAEHEITDEQWTDFGDTEEAGLLQCSLQTNPVARLYCFEVGVP